MSLRAQAVRGGAYLSVREVAGIGVRLIGVTLLTRLLGPESYGLYAGSAALVTVLAVAAQMGVEVYLVRRPEEPSREAYDEVFSFLLAAALTTSVLGLALSFVVDDWLRDQRFVDPFRVLLVSIPLNVLWAPAQAKLERALAFRRIAWLELGGDLMLYGPALVLAWRGAGVWAPVCGYIAWQSWLLAGSYRMAGYRPRLTWSSDRSRELLTFGVGYAPASLVQRAEDLVNPLVVGRYLGAESVGYVALALRLKETLSFVSRASWRISIVVLSRVRGDARRARRALEEGMALQVMALGPLLGAFSLTAPWAVPLLFGPGWVPVVSLYPLIAFAALTSAMFSMHSSLLYVWGRNLRVLAVNGLRLVLLGGSALVFVPLLGLPGYGLAAIAPTAAYAVSHAAVRASFGFSYRAALPWLIAFAPTVFSAAAPWPVALILWLPALALVMVPTVRAQLAGYAGLLARGRWRSGGEVSTSAGP